MRIFVLFYCITSFSFVPETGYAQNAKINIESDKVISVHEVFNLIKSQTNYRFIYPSNLFNDFSPISLKKGTIRVKKLLEQSLSQGDFSIRLGERETIIIRAESDKSQQEIKGKIIDETGQPLPQVTVYVKGTQNGVTSDFDGNYTIKANQGDVLIFSYVGMLTTEIEVKDQLNIDVTLKVDTQSLEEVVIVGYGTQKRKDITGSVSRIDVAQVNKLAPVNFETALVGAAPGVQVITASGAPGAPASIRIRGITSVFGNNEPLYVIDGLPIELGQGQGNSFFSSNFSSTISPLSSINPLDIESIDILKDASATAIYGSRGANGVIIVTTKKGSYSSVPNISLSVVTSISEFTKDYDMLDSDGFHQVIETAYQNRGTTLPADDQLYPYGTNVNTDWQKETAQAAINTNYYLNANGGSLNGSSLYSLSAGVAKQQGAIDFTEFKRNNIRTKLETKLSEKLRVGINFNYSESKNNGSNTTFYYQTLTYRPDVPIFDEDGNYGHDTGNVQSNPYAKVRYPAFVENKTLTVSLFGEYEISKGLLFKSTYNYTTSDNHSFRYTPSYDVFELRNNRKGTLNQNNSNFSSRIFDNTLTFNKNLNKHNINAVAGVSYTQTKSDGESVRATDFPDDEVSVSPGAASSLELTSTGTISGLSSYFARANYNFNEKYYLTFTGRADKSTKFGPENRWGYFPSGAAAWRISKEEFLQDNELIDDLKLRASYGKTGSANFSDFQYATFFSAGSFYNNHNGVTSNTIPNPAIKWETTDQLDIALDFSMLDRRLNGTIGYFNKKTSDQILFRDVILETGGTSQFANIGDFGNKGFEFQVGYDVVENEKFQWTTNLNLTTIKSKVLKLNGGYYSNLIEGESLSYFDGYKVEGIFDNQGEIDALNAASPTGVYQSGNTAPGDFKFADQNGDGFVGGEDIDIIGDAAPDFFGGWNNIVRFGNFEVSALFNFSVGNYLYNARKGDLFIFNSYTSNYEAGILNAWSPTNKNTDIPRLVQGDPNNNDRDSDFFIEDASFFKLKNLNVTYKLNPDLLKKLFIQRASISLSATDIFTITKYSGLDPEVNYSASNLSQGFDSGSYPAVRTFTLGINLNL